MEPLDSIGTMQVYTRPHQAPDTGAAVGTGAAAAERRTLTLPQDRVSLSGQRLGPDQPDKAAEAAAKEPKPGERTAPDGKRTEDPQVKQTVERLKQTEEKVKAHEAAHKAAGGNLAGSASYSYTQGPDGRSYITGGEVQIDLSPGRTPQETISKMQQVIRAALAPADPSGQDRAVAAQAASQMTQAQQEKLQAASPANQGQDAKPSDPAQPAPTQASQAYADPAVRNNEAAFAGSGAAAPLSPYPSADNRRSPASGLSTYA